MCAYVLTTAAHGVPEDGMMKKNPIERISKGIPEGTKRDIKRKEGNLPNFNGKREEDLIKRKFKTSRDRNTERGDRSTERQEQSKEVLSATSRKPVSPP